MWKRTALMIALLGLLVPAGTLAQDASASPAASVSPAAGACVAPGLPAGSPTPVEPEVSPAGQASPSPDAEPATSPAPASEPPVPLPSVPAGEAAEPPTSDEVTAAAQNLIDCLNSGDYLGFAALVTPDLLVAFFGLTNPYDVPVALEGLPFYTLESMGGVIDHEDGRTSIDIRGAFGDEGPVHERWFFLQDGALLLDEIMLFPS